MAAAALPFQCCDPESHSKKNSTEINQLICPALFHQGEGREKKGRHADVFTYF